MPTHVTDFISGEVNNSQNQRKFGDVAFVKINSLSADLITILGGQIGNDTVEDPQHSQIISMMAFTAFVAGKQLQIEFNKFENGRIWAVTVNVV
jgi:hypothetical protein